MGLPLTGMMKPPNPHMDHIFGLRQQLLSAASSAASMAASVAASGRPAVSPQRALLDGKNSSPASSLERPRSPIDLDDTSNDGSNSVTSPKSLSDRSSTSAFRQVKRPFVPRPQNWPEDNLLIQMKALQLQNGKNM